VGTASIDAFETDKALINNHQVSSCLYGGRSCCRWKAT